MNHYFLNFKYNSAGFKQICLFKPQYITLKMVFAQNSIFFNDYKIC